MKKACDCFSKVYNQLADHNGILEFNLLASPPRAMISVSKRDQRNRQKPPLIEASFCPFCGSKYPKSTRDIAAKFAASAAP